MRVATQAWAIVLVSICIPFATAQTVQKPAMHAAQSGDSAIDRISKDANAAREANRMADAIALYKKGVALKPSWEEGWWYLGTLYYDLDDYPKGRDAFHHLAQINPKIAVAWAMLGLCEYETRQYDLALKHLSNGVQLGVDTDQNVSDVTHYHLALLLTRNEQYEQAMKALAMFAQRNTNAPAYVEAMGIAALRKPLLPTELPPSERELVMDVGRAMYDAAALKTTEAAADFKTVVAKYPTTPNIHYLYGSFLMYSDANEGLAQFKKELEYSPSHVPSLVTIASEYITRKDYKTGLPYAEKAVDIDAANFAAHAVLGRILSEGDIDTPRGVKELEQAKKLEPGSPQVRIALATAYTHAGLKEQAAREREEFLKLKKQSDTASARVP
jgi:tetratricopeptide (TPR) repeat protein